MNSQILISSLHEQSLSQAPLILRSRSEVPAERSADRPDFQPVIDRLRTISLEFNNCNDELSESIQKVADQFTLTDCSAISQASEIIRIAQDCRSQFTKILCNDLDKAPLDKPTVIRGWKFEEWQLIDYIKLDKFFGQRQIALSPFDQLPIPEDYTRHEFAQAIIDLIKTIPEVLQETNQSPLLKEQQAVVAAPTIQEIFTFALQNRGNGVLDREVVEKFTPENFSTEQDIIVGFQIYNNWKKLATASVQEKKRKQEQVQLKIDIAARKLERENVLQQIINQEAQKLQDYFNEMQHQIQDHLDEVEEARVEIANLKEQLDESTNKLNKLRDDLTVQEKKSENLQQQLYIEQTKYARLAQEFQQLRNKLKKKPWYQFW